MRTVSARRLLVTFGAVAAIVATTSGSIPVGAASTATATSEFDSPSGLAFGGGHLWVANAANSSVSEISPATGAWLGNFRSIGYGFFHPTAVVDDGGEVFVANANGTVTEIRASNGGLVRRITGTRYHFSRPVAITTANNDVLVLNSGTSGSITVFSVSTGALIRNIRGAAYALSDPAAFATSGTDVFVADKGNNSVTEVNVASGKLIRVVANRGLSAPDGIAIGAGDVWVADQFTSGVTEISSTTGALLANMTDANGSFGFWHPTVMISTGDSIYTATPLGTSPMVTKISATTGHPYWYMCNTNGPYYFSLLSAFAISSGNLWVASQSGANSKTSGASTGSLTELSLGSGSLIKTLPTH